MLYYLNIGIIAENIDNTTCLCCLYLIGDIVGVYSYENKCQYIYDFEGHPFVEVSITYIKKIRKCL